MVGALTTPRAGNLWARLVDAVAGRARREVDIASLVVFRVAFGALMTVASLRFFAHGWIHEYYEVPKHFFHYWGFGWVKPWPGIGMYVHYALMVIAAAFVMVGFRYRESVALFGALFTYAHFCDKTNYLNHYYLVALLSLLMVFLPLDRAGSVRAWRRPEEAWSSVPAWCVWLLRFQVGCVYVFGGVAKLKGDWLLHAQPLTIWLGANTEFPLIGRLFAEKWMAYAFSWCGAAFDLSVVGFLSFTRTRLPAYAAVVFFHAVTARLFQLGMFPWMMTVLALVFFEPGFARPLLQRLRILRPRGVGEATPVRRSLPIVGKALIALHVALQVLLPLRHWLYPGNVLWTEQGFRFAWNVMLMEKNGALDMKVVDRASGRTSVIDPHDWLTRYQIKMMSTQPDMILEFAHVVADDLRAKGQEVEVHVESQVSLNGRRPHPLIDPRVDLGRVSEGLGAKPWILPGPTEPPEF